jgi:hypothetical protein
MRLGPLVPGSKPAHILAAEMRAQEVREIGALTAAKTVPAETLSTL